MIERKKQAYYKYLSDKNMTPREEYRTLKQQIQQRVVMGKNE